MRRPTINITPTERAGRIAIGGAGAIGGLILLASASGALAVVLSLLLVLAGLDLWSPAPSGTARCTQSSATCPSH